MTPASARVKLRPLAEADAPALHAVLSDPATCRFTPTFPLLSLTSTNNFIETCQRHAALGSVHSFAVVPFNGTNALVGLVQASRLTGEIELGYALATARWGDGLMSDAIATLLRWAASHVGDATVWATCDVEHTAARRMLDGLGFMLDGVLPRHRVHPALGPDPRDCVRYAGRLVSLGLS